MKTDVNELISPDLPWARRVKDFLAAFPQREILAVSKLRHQNSLSGRPTGSRGRSGDVNTVVQAAMGGTNATTVLEADRQFNVAVRLNPEDRTSVDAISTVKVTHQTPSGKNAYIPLSELADITLDTGASFIYRESTQRYIPIEFSVRGRESSGYSLSGATPSAIRAASSVAMGWLRNARRPTTRPCTGPRCLVYRRRSCRRRSTKLAIRPLPSAGLAA